MLLLFSFRMYMKNIEVKNETERLFIKIGS